LPALSRDSGEGKPGDFFPRVVDGKGIKSLHLAHLLLPGALTNDGGVMRITAAAEDK
jgi:hypothetical protein